MTAKTYNDVAATLFKPERKFDDDTADGITLRTWEQRLSLKMYNWVRDYWNKHLNKNHKSDISSHPQSKFHPDFPYGSFEREGRKYNWMVGVSAYGDYYMLVSFKLAESDKHRNEALGLIRALGAFYDKKAELDLDGLTDAETTMLVEQEEAMKTALTVSANRFKEADAREKAARGA